MKLFDLPTDVLCKIFEFDDTYRLMYNRVLKEMLDINDVLASLILETNLLARVFVVLPMYRRPVARQII